MLFNPSNSTTGFLLQTMLYVANITKNDLNRPKLLEDFKLSPMGADSDPNQPRCYGLYECFEITPPWTTDSRPISNYPESPSKINPRYAVYTHHNRHMPKYLSIEDSSEVKYSGIHAKGTIYMIAHGYLDSGDRNWVLQLMNALLDRDHSGIATVITIDWSGGASPPYTQAVANIRLVGVMTAHVLHMVYEQLKMKNLDNVHMIGHSLGAHLSGYTGDKLKRGFGLSLGRITALDPAEPLFTDTDAIVRLDRNDAKFVDVVHTDILPLTRFGLGMKEPIGHVDFYPNGGHTNPGCDEPMRHYIASTESFSLGLQQFFSCNHVRSQEFFLESVKSNCSFTGVVCDSYENFMNGHCTCRNDRDTTSGVGTCIRFGLETLSSYKEHVTTSLVTNGQPIKAYFLTGHRAPFCRSHFKLTVHLSASKESLGHGEEVGTLLVEFLSVKGHKSDRIRFSREAMSVEPSNNYTAIIPVTSIGIPEAVILDWDYQSSVVNPFSWRIVAPRVYIEYIRVESLDYNLSLSMCPIYPNEPVVAGTPSEFRRSYCNTYRNGK